MHSWRKVVASLVSKKQCMHVWAICSDDFKMWWTFSTWLEQWNGMRFVLSMIWLLDKLCTLSLHCAGLNSMNDEFGLIWIIAVMLEHKGRRMFDGKNVRSVICQWYTAAVYTICVTLECAAYIHCHNSWWCDLECNNNSSGKYLWLEWVERALRSMKIYEMHYCTCSLELSGRQSCLVRRSAGKAWVNVSVSSTAPTMSITCPIHCRSRWRILTSSTLFFSRKNT